MTKKIPRSVNYNDSIVLQKCLSKVQRCLVCREVIGPTIAVCLRNKNDDIELKKYLWMHIECSDKLCLEFPKFIKDNKEMIEDMRKKIFIERL